MLCIALGGSIPEYCSIDPELKAVCLPSLQTHISIQLLMGVMQEIAFSACCPPWGLIVCWVGAGHSLGERGCTSLSFGKCSSAAVTGMAALRWGFRCTHRGCLEM